MLLQYMNYYIFSYSQQDKKQRSKISHQLKINKEIEMRLSQSYLQFEIIGIVCYLVVMVIQYNTAIIYILFCFITLHTICYVHRYKTFYIQFDAFFHSLYNNRILIQPILTIL